MYSLVCMGAGVGGEPGCLLSGRVDKDRFIIDFFLLFTLSLG